MKGIFFVAGESATNKTEMIKEALVSLKDVAEKIDLFTPIGDSEDALYSVKDALEMIVQGKVDTLIETVIDSYKEKEAQYDFIIVEGSSLDSSEPILEFKLNTLIAKHLGLPVVLVTKKNASLEETSSLLSRMLKKDAINVLGNVSDFSSVMELIQEARRIEIGYLSTKMFQWKLLDNARKDRRKIVLPESECDRVLKAAAVLNKGKIADLILLGKKETILQKAQDLGIVLDGITIIDPNESEKKEEYAQTYYELRKLKGATLEQSRELMQDGAYFGTMMVYKGEADGMISGAVHTTAHTIRPALQFIKTKKGTSLVSGMFIMCLKGRLYIFADCAVTPNPTSEQLSEIATTTAQTARMFGLDPKVAFLSYGTGNSGKGPDVDLVKEAVRLTQEKNVNFDFEGPIQFDAAIDPVVAQTKLPDSKVAGQANVFVFPDLNTGNCCYKAIQRALGEECLAVGPILQGLNKPVNDLSRGATVADIINTVGVTVLFAQKGN